MELERVINLDFLKAAERLKDTVQHTPLEYNNRLSEKYQAHIYLKREDKQVVRSYKLRGAYNMMSQIPADKTTNGVVCASAGNHAQGVAFSCNKLKIKGTIFMPEITPKQKTNQTKMFGNGWIDIVLVGDTFDDCLAEALDFTTKNNMTFVPPFDHFHIMEGQGTVGVEVLADLPDTDIVIMPIGGGGLAAGAGTYFKQIKPNIKLIGVEPEGAPSMNAAFKAGRSIKLDQMKKNWYAVYTKSRCEKKVSALLTKKKIENYCPLNRLLKQSPDRKKIVQEPLFTSYVFVHITEMEMAAIRQISSF